MPSLYHICGTGGSLNIGVAIGVTIYLEKVYSLPGLGNLTTTALSGAVGYDLPIILGIALVVGAAIILLNLIVDLLYPVIDPTLRQEEVLVGPSVA
jgi:peptide/nickel transport system permease protein